MNIQRVWKQVFKHISGLFVTGIGGKAYNVISFNGYMKAKEKHMQRMGIHIESPLRYVSSDAYFDGHDYSKISIAKDVTISREVMFLTHDYSLGSGLRACGYIVEEGRDKTPHFLKGIEIGESTFIGARASILPGTKIGRGCIIGACAVVKGNIPDFSIVIGNPGRIVGDVREWVQKNI